ncbi:hypothetical protein K0M31_011979 [Melipona bicolor]|uniref:Uncharacterized protein n=1 Tax=Melipona bicolor TaxID=60889 RepID=A0AA40KVB1_9HYME|nr:hypothetical protein K0M31_011979 [Melipona bicolor]
MTGLCARSGPVSSLDESGYLSVGSKRNREEEQKKGTTSARAEPSERKKEKGRVARRWSSERKRAKRLGCEVNVSSKLADETMAAAAGARAAVDADVAGGQRHRDGCTGWSDEDPHFGASSTKLKRE